MKNEFKLIKLVQKKLSFNQFGDKIIITFTKGLKVQNYI
jgi:hypothetical protein